MKTPFDAALRIEQRAIDAIRLALTAGIAEQRQAAQASEAIEDHIVAERRHGSGDWQCTAHPYLDRIRGQRDAIADARTKIDAEMEDLRNAALAAAGQRRSVARAAAGFRSHATQRRATTEQAQADDFAGAQFFARRLARGSVSRTAAGLQ